MKPEFIIPDWPVEAKIKSLSSTRLGGVSKSPYGSFNLGDHVEDELVHVTKNRQLLKQHGRLPAEPYWLQQVHGTKIVNLADEAPGVKADGSVCDQPNLVCVVQTADCLPLLVTTKEGNRVGAIHAGWRGLVSGIIENGIAAMAAEPEKLFVWLGPAIGPECFEVGEDVLQAFEARYPGYKNIFFATGNKKWHMNIYEAARVILGMNGIKEIYGGDFCTYSDDHRFYSYRRDKVCGRMASMIWIEE